MYFAGNRKLMSENNIYISQELQAKSDEWGQLAKTIIWFADNKKALAVLAISDKIKETSVTAIRKMQEMGIEMYMLTGSNIQSHRRANRNQALQSGGVTAGKIGICKRVATTGKSCGYGGRRHQRQRRSCTG